ncbi:Rossmann-like and DUF2520 domain-containing protein [Microbacterium sp. SORGH_AS_0888]|uniref:Rossmann-like and DUF2520 domain-containing protein n=1 Tax=Microbacterium sp. SORGH_AS_0888 TaxID=3041791 RepID=UPI002789668C|nr:Rossmann-like and DUF2520 domain-containing protein [Microbacterium sp. SORGH_AS_0888]MDQ1130557.1 putative short-subunit dehydrogenase-like oxidoreductase (DUF2520 family) [Microbacterium sp. SORGH_AS_0888]
MTTSASFSALRLDGPVLVVGDGRMGRALVAALDAAAVPVIGPAGRGETGSDAGIVLLAVPDAAIATAARAIAPGRLVGHLSGALDLSPLQPHEAFSIHPLMTVTGAGASFAGVTAALAGTTPRAHATAAALADVLGMTGVTVRDEDRAAYHAAASVAANFLVTLEGLAERLAATAGVDREALVPLVRAAVDNWAERGAAAALTGPVSRGDAATIARQRQAVAERLPDRVALFDTLVAATQDLAAEQRAGTTAAT